MFPEGDKNYTFLNDHVDEATFYGKLPEKDPYLTARFETDLLGAGYRLNDKLFLSAGLSVSGYGHADIPRELLRFAKTGRSGGSQSWMIEGPHASFLTYATFSAGCSYDLDDLVPGLRVGGRLRLMTGLNSANATLHMLDVQMNDERLAATVRGIIDLSGFSYTPEGGFRSDGFRLHGLGAAFDLGAEYRLRFDGFVNGLNLSASIANVGKLSFGKANRLKAEHSASFEGFQDISADFDFASALEKVTSDFSELVTLESDGTPDLRYSMSPEIFAGAEVPFLNDMLSVGLLYNRSMDKNHMTVAFNATPLEWLNLNAHYTFGPVGRMGFYAEYIPKKYVGFFFGFEKASWKTNKQLLGIRNFTESVCLGLNVLL